MKELATRHKPVDLSLAPVRMMREFLRRRQLEESGVTGVSIWAESHAAIHTWDEDNYYAFDAFSCRDFRPKDALRLLLTHFDIEMLNCVNLYRFQRPSRECPTSRSTTTGRSSSTGRSSASWSRSTSTNWADIRPAREAPARPTSTGKKSASGSAGALFGGPAASPGDQLAATSRGCRRAPRRCAPRP